MKKILITAKETGTGFDGAVELIYGLPRMGDSKRPIVMMDFRGATLSDKARGWFLRNVPEWYGADFAQEWGLYGSKINITDADLEFDFENDFWKPYGKKKDKDRALRQWNNASKAVHAQIVWGLAGYLRYLSQNTWRPKKAADEFIRQKMYLTDWDNYNGE